jgi:hypothetical protein
MVQIHSPRPLLLALTRNFLFFVYSAVDDLVGGRVRRDQQVATPVSRQNLIRAENGAISLVPAIEKRVWSRSRIALRSAKVLLGREAEHMRVFI